MATRNLTTNFLRLRALAVKPSRGGGGEHGWDMSHIGGAAPRYVETGEEVNTAMRNIEARSACGGGARPGGGGPLRRAGVVRDGVASARAALLACAGMERCLGVPRGRPLASSPSRVCAVWWRCSQ